VGDPEDVELDLYAGKLYWIDSLSGSVLRANLDGSGTETLVTGLPFGYGLALYPPFLVSGQGLPSEIEQPVTSASPGGYPSTPPIEWTLYPSPSGPPLVDVDVVLIRAAEENGNGGIEVSSDATVYHENSFDNEVLTLEAAIGLSTPPSDKVVTVEISQEFASATLALPSPDTLNASVEYDPFSGTFNIFLELQNTSGGEQVFRLWGRPSSGQPPGGVEITDVQIDLPVPMPGDPTRALSMTIELLVTSTYDDTQPVIAIDFSGVETSATATAVPSVSPVAVSLLILWLAAAGSALLRQSSAQQKSCVR
jgi:hypothetical protein